jgi:hypothetical protein
MLEVGDKIVVKDTFCKHCSELLGLVGTVESISLDCVKVSVRKPSRVFNWFTGKDETIDHTYVVYCDAREIVAYND